MNYKAVSTHLKQIKRPLPVICIVIIWLLTTYFFYTHKAQKPEVKKISDSSVSQKVLQTITPTPKISNAPSPRASENSVAAASLDNANDSVVSQNTTSANNSDENSNTNDATIISPTQIPVIDTVTRQESIPTVTPQPTSPEIENSTTPTPTTEQSSNDNSSPVTNTLATTVDNLTQALPLDLVK